MINPLNGILFSLHNILVHICTGGIERIKEGSVIMIEERALVLLAGMSMYGTITMMDNTWCRHCFTHLNANICINTIIYHITSQFRNRLLALFRHVKESLLKMHIVILFIESIHLLLILHLESIPKALLAPLPLMNSLRYFPKGSKSDLNISILSVKTPLENMC